jgi:2-keto-4-pentenoate hydratase/2-oxohepta-3-ene-1,7-dioic acid hydratase in catechol pathway
MLWKIDALISYVSQYFTLKIGDVIFTGTPAGVARVQENDKLKGYIGETEMFSINVK